MSKILSLNMEVAGCPTSCMHCWARGRRYEAMPSTDVAWVLEAAHRFCSEAGLSLSAVLMHEVLAHPEASEVLKRFKPFASDEDGFEPIPTTGVPLAIREDWRDLLATARTLGTNTFWFAFHGIGETHDRVVNRVGAFRETGTAVERVRAMGFRSGCNVFLTKENVEQFDDLLPILQNIGIQQTSWGPATYYPTARLRRYEPLRPELDDLLPLVDRVSSTSSPFFHRDRWEHLEARTEATYCDKALQDSEEHDQGWSSFVRPNYINLVCRSNLDLHSGNAGLYGPLHGNLKTDGAEQVFEKALDGGSISEESLYFSTSTIPSIYELAQEFGDTRGQKIYFHPASMRYRWLDLALAEYRRY